MSGGNKPPEPQRRRKTINTVTYVTDNNSPLTPNASLILGSTGGDAEEAWLRKNFDGLWDDEEGREFADALLEGLAAADARTDETFKAVSRAQRVRLSGE